MIKVNMSDMKSKKEVSEAMEKQISEFGDIAKQLNKRMQPMILRMQKAAESAAIKCGMLESDFDEIMSQYKAYFLKEGFITPKHFEEFFSWLCGCRWAESNEPFGAMEIKESDFTLYHKYKELKLNPYGWNDHQERERLEVMFNPQTATSTDSRTKKLIIEFFNNLDKKGWEYSFLSEQDFSLFIEILTCFFESKPYSLPKELIQLKRNCKTKVAKTLGDIHKELSNEDNLINDNEYFKIIKILSHFSTKPKSELYKDLTR